MTSIDTEDDKLDLPPGFRFHPTDEELIYQYLYKKVLGISFSSAAIGEVDLNKSEPWELPWKAKMGGKELYFFCTRDRKYPTGLRTNRATNSGYWKATGKDKEIYRGKSLVGMKKTLVFYKGRAPKGVKTNWVMHEYRLEGHFSIHNLPTTAKNEWVICRVFHKGPDGKKFHTLMDPSPYINSSKTKPVVAESPYVPCFSNSLQQNTVDRRNFGNDHVLQVPSNDPSLVSPQFAVPSSFYGGDFRSPGSVSVQEQPMLRTSIGNHGSNLETGKKAFDDRDAPSSSSSAGRVDLDCFWHY